jgi:hypothetical protein
MPFQSKAQMKKCFAMRGRGQAKGWNCEEWAHKTPSLKKLPEHKPEEKKANILVAMPMATAPAATPAATAIKTAIDRRTAVVTELEKQASTLPQLLGVRCAALALGLVPT